MPKTSVIFAVLGGVALLIVALAVFFILNVSRITLLESGILIAVAVIGLAVVVVLIVSIVRGMLKK